MLACLATSGSFAFVPSVPGVRSGRQWGSCEWGAVERCRASTLVSMLDQGHGNAPAEPSRRCAILRALLSVPALTGVGARAAIEPGDPVRDSQPHAATSEEREPYATSDVRPLTASNADAMFQLTSLQGWDNTLEDLELLLAMQGSGAFGVFSSSGELVSMSAVTHFPAMNGGPGAAWLSYVITRKDFRRRGLARKTCNAAIKWLDDSYPSCSIGLYGEPTKAAPLYLELGFADKGKGRFWRGSYGADLVLAQDSSAKPVGKGKRAVNSKVRAISVGTATALTIRKGSALLSSVLASDSSLLGSSRAQALESWNKQSAFLCWGVPNIDRSRVSKIFALFCDKESGRLQYEGLRDLVCCVAGVYSLFQHAAHTFTMSHSHRIAKRWGWKWSEGNTMVFAAASACRLRTDSQKMPSSSCTLSPETT